MHRRVWLFTELTTVICFFVVPKNMAIVFKAKACTCLVSSSIRVPQLSEFSEMIILFLAGKKGIKRGWYVL